MEQEKGRAKQQAAVAIDTDRDRQIKARYTAKKQREFAQRNKIGCHKTTYFSSTVCKSIKALAN